MNALRGVLSTLTQAHGHLAAPKSFNGNNGVSSLAFLT